MLLFFGAILQRALLVISLLLPKKLIALLCIPNLKQCPKIAGIGSHADMIENLVCAVINDLIIFRIAKTMGKGNAVSVQPPRPARHPWSPVCGAKGQVPCRGRSLPKTLSPALLFCYRVVHFFWSGRCFPDTMIYIVNGI